MSNQTKWSIDQAHSEITFRVRHLMIANVRGSFKTFDASIYTTDKDFLTVEIDLWIDVDSISTGNELRDNHLKSADFLNAAVHKQISFTSSTIGKEIDGKHDLWGEFTMNGITKNLKLQVEFGGMLEDPWGKEKAGFNITGKFNRNDWGLVWNSKMEAGGIMVSDEVHISCELELVNVGEKDLTMILETSPNSQKKGVIL